MAFRHYDYNDRPRFIQPHRNHPSPREEPFINWRPGHGWWQGDKKLKGFQSKKYWARPVDGARRGFCGRLKDGLTGEGPDVFLVLNGDRRTLHRDMPHRARWSNWDTTKLRWVAEEQVKPNWRMAFDEHESYPFGNLGSMPWATREDDNVYNFRTRKYDDIRALNSRKFWSDVRWPQGERRHENTLPVSFRDWDGKWATRRPSLIAPRDMYSPPRDVYSPAFHHQPYHPIDRRFYSRI